MNLFDSPLFRYGFFAVSAVFLVGLTYFVFVGVRALFREARQMARDAGHSEGSAALRAFLRMAVWAAFFGLFYAFAFLIGRRLGWWAAPIALGGLVATIGGVLLADKLLTVNPSDRGAQVKICATLGLLVVLLGVGAWLAF